MGKNTGQFVICNYVFVFVQKMNGLIAEVSTECLARIRVAKYPLPTKRVSDSLIQFGKYWKIGSGARRGQGPHWGTML